MFTATGEGNSPPFVLSGHQRCELRSTTAGGETTTCEYAERPWGNFTVLSDAAADHKVKCIVVYPGKRLSYQRHAKRAEHWYVVSGTAKVTLEGAVTELLPGQAIDIPMGAAHRVTNDGTLDVVFIEVQHGTYFGEDDIVRLEDDFGRAEREAHLLQRRRKPPGRG